MSTASRKLFNEIASSCSQGESVLDRALREIELLRQKKTGGLQAEIKPTGAEDPILSAESILAEWDDLYRAFKGAFDTPQQRRLMPDMYSQDARARMGRFNELISNFCVAQKTEHEEEIEDIKEVFHKKLSMQSHDLAYYKELAAKSQLREEQWRDAVLMFRNDPALERAHKVRSTEGYGAMERLLDSQVDAGLLEQIKAECVAAGGEVMRRRAMNACDALYEKSEWACEDHPTAANAEEEIRSLPGVKIEDLVRENDAQPENISRTKPRPGRA